MEDELATDNNSFKSKTIGSNSNSLVSAKDYNVKKNLIYKDLDLTKVDVDNINITLSQIIPANKTRGVIVQNLVLKAIKTLAKIKIIKRLLNYKINNTWF